GPLGPAPALAHPHLPPRRPGTAAGPRRRRQVSVGPALARPGVVLRVFPRRQRRRNRREPPDRLDGPGSEALAAERRLAGERAGNDGRRLHSEAPGGSGRGYPRPGRAPSPPRPPPT